MATCDTNVIQVSECDSTELINNGDNTYTYDPLGSNVTFSAYHLSTATFNTSTKVLTLTLNNGTALNVTIPCCTTIADSNPNDGIIEITYNGTTYNISENFTDISGPDVNGVITATHPNGDEVTWNEGGVTDVADNLDGTYTATLSDGTDVTWRGSCSPLLTVSTGNDDDPNNAIESADIDCGESLHIYSSDSSINISVSEGSGIVDITATDQGGNTSSVTDNGDGTYLHDNGDGDTVVIQGGFTSVAQNGLTGVMTFTYPDASTVVINMPNMLNNADGTYDFNDGLGNTTVIDTITLLVDNANGTTTITNTAGDTAIVYNNYTDVTDNADGTVDFTLPDSSVITVDICALLANCSVGNLGDVDVTSTPPSNNDILVWNGVNWVPTEPTLGTGTVDTITLTTDGDSTGISTSGTAADPIIDIVILSTDADNLLDTGSDGGVHLDPADIFNTIAPPYATVNATDGDADKIFSISSSGVNADTSAFTGTDKGRVRVGSTKNGVLYDSGIVLHNSAWSFPPYGSGVIGGAGTFDCGQYATDNALSQARFWIEYTPYSVNNIAGPPVMALFECSEASGSLCAGSEICYFDFSASGQNPVTNLRNADTWDISNSDWELDATVNDILDGTPDTITNYGNFGTGLNVTVTGDRNHASNSNNDQGTPPFIQLIVPADGQTSYSEMTFTFNSPVTGALIFDAIRLGQTVDVTADVVLDYADFPDGTPGLTVTGSGTNSVNLTTAIGDSVNRSGMLCGVDITSFTFTFTSKNTNAFNVNLDFTFFAEDTTYGTHIYRLCTDDGEGGTTFERISGSGGVLYTSPQEYMCESTCP